MGLNKIIVILCFLALNIKSEIFTQTDLHLMHRPGEYIISPDKKYIIFSDSKWNNITGDKPSNILYKEILSDDPPKNLTIKKAGQKDVNPYISSAFPNFVFFMRKHKIMYKEFPPKETSIEMELSNYPIDLINIKIVNDILVFTAEVYFNCTTLECTAELNKIEKKQDYKVYNKLASFHWDNWLTENKGNHIFYQKIELDKITNKLILKDSPKDLTKNMEISVPPYSILSDNGNNYFDISKDGKMISFIGLKRDKDEAFSSSWQTYLFILDSMENPILISNNTVAKTKKPKFNKDGTKLGFLSMNLPHFGDDTAYFTSYNILTNKIESVTIFPLDQSIESYEWYKDNEIIFIATAYQVDRLYHLNFHDPFNPIYTEISPDKNYSYSKLVAVIYDNTNNFIISSKVGYDLPQILVKIDLKTKEEKILIDLNKIEKSKFTFSKNEDFHFIGAYNDTVYGSIFKPINYEKGKKYPSVLLIHGGPEGAWLPEWNLKWNPEVYVNQGYVVFMINPHGSFGITTDFKDKIRGNWRLAYEDIMLGVEYVKNNYDFIDSDKICAAGASYGGYLISWIAGHTKIFKCLVNHAGIFDSYYYNYAADILYFAQVQTCPREKPTCKPYESQEIRNFMNLNNPERFVDNWSTPMLVTQGGIDYRVRLTYGLSVFTALQLKGIKSKFIYFPKENHWILKPENSVLFYTEVLKWLDEYLKK